MGMVLCISMIFAAVPVYGAESTEPNVNQDGKIVSEIDSRHNDIEKRDELIASLGERRNGVSDLGRRENTNSADSDGVSGVAPGIPIPKSASIRSC